MKNLPCNRCPLFPDEPGQNVLASSTCFETGHELRESIYKHCTRLQNKAKKGTLLYHCGGSILSSSPSILLSEIHSTVLGFNSNWRLSGQNQDTQEEEKEFCVLILKLSEVERNHIMRPWKTRRGACSLIFRSS